MPDRARPIRDPKLLATYAALVSQCQVCGAKAFEPHWWSGRKPLQIHHLVKRGRSDEHCNLLRVCWLCHALIEGHQVRDPVTKVLYPSLQPRGVQFGVKRDHDRARWEPERLAQLHGGPLPELRPLPAVYEALWQASQPVRRSATMS